MKALIVSLFALAALVQMTYSSPLQIGSAKSGHVGMVPYSPVGKCPPHDGENATYLADDENCQRFYECRFGVPIQLECPPGTLFNINLNVCDWPENVNCKDTDPCSKLARNGGVSPFIPVGECPNPEGERPVYLPDSVDCNVYYVCSHGRPIQMECPGGLEWNTALKACDWPQNANCKACSSKSRHV